MSAGPRPGRIRSALFTPGVEAARLRKAVTVGADICIFDLEDSVPRERDGEARQIVAGALHELGARSRIWVRVHAASDRRMADDIGALPLDRLDGIVLPKVSDPDDIEACVSALAASKSPDDLPLMALVESAAGVLNSRAIADARGVLCLALGRFDLAADLGIDPDLRSPALTAARALVVLASAAAHLHPPLDSPWLKIQDLSGLGEVATGSRREGFGGMLLIHPAHVDLVNRVFAPTADEIAWASETVGASEAAAAAGRGAFARDGQMVDEAIVRRARAILRAAAQGG
jgi:citrate lyase subunit beta / citryl-CoA lyase